MLTISTTRLKGRPHSTGVVPGPAQAYKFSIASSGASVLAMKQKSS